MIALMLVLAVPSCFVEYKLTSNRPAVRMFFAEHKLAALGFSTAVSALFGIIFGAAGLIVFGAAMLSTMGMLVIYGLEPKIKKSKAVVGKNKDGFIVAGKLVVITFKVTIFVLLVPIKFLGLFLRSDSKV